MGQFKLEEISICRNSVSTLPNVRSSSNLTHRNLTPLVELFNTFGNFGSYIVNHYRLAFDAFKRLVVSSIQYKYNARNSAQKWYLVVVTNSPLFVTNYYYNSPAIVLSPPPSTSLITLVD